MLGAMHSRNSVRTIVIISVVGSLLFAGGLGAFLFWYEGNEKDAAQTASDELAAALVDNEPSKAPDGASDYVRPTRKYFGPIKSAKTVDVRQVDNYGESSNTADDRSWWTSTIFMRTERGAALLLVTYADSFDPKDAKVEAIRELSPKKVAEKALTAAEMSDAKAGFESRDRKLASDIMLSDTFFQKAAQKRRGGNDAPGEPVPAPPSDEDIERRRAEGQKRLKCVQDAKGDVEKMAKC